MVFCRRWCKQKSLHLAAEIFIVGTIMQNLLVFALFVNCLVLGSASLKAADQMPINFARGNELYSQGKFAEAEKEYRASLAICERTLGANHPCAVASRNALANVLEKQNKHDEAELQKSAVKSIEDQKDPDTAAMPKLTYECMTLHNEGKYAEEEVVIRKVLAIQERRMKHGPGAWFVYDRLAVCLENQGKLKEALSYIQRALADDAKFMAAYNPQFIKDKETRDRIVQKLAEQEHRVVPKTTEPPPANPLREELVRRNAEEEQRRNDLKRVDNVTLMNDSIRAEMFHAQRNYAEEEKALVAMLDTLHRTLGMDHASVFSTSYKLALCFENEGKLKEALAYIRETEEGSSRVLGARHPQTEDALRARKRIEAKLGAQ